MAEYYYYQSVANEQDIKMAATMYSNAALAGDPQVRPYFTGVYIYFVFNLQTNLRPYSFHLWICLSTD